MYKKDETANTNADKLIIKGLLSLMSEAVCDYAELIDYSDDEYDNFTAQISGKKFKISAEQMQNKPKKEMYMEKSHKGCGKYYIVVDEWNYPTESGRNLLTDFDTFEEALDFCKEIAEDELYEFEKNCKVDALPPERCEPNGKDCGGVIITPKNGLEPYYYYARVIEMETL